MVLEAILPISRVKDVPSKRKDKQEFKQSGRKSDNTDTLDDVKEYGEDYYEVFTLMSLAGASHISHVKECYERTGKQKPSKNINIII